MDDSALFTDFVAKNGFGTRLNTTRLQKAESTVLARQASRATAMLRSARGRHSGLPLIHFDWIDSDRPNAIAFLHKDRYFIGITSGAMLKTQMLFLRMLAHPNILPQIGNPQVEIGISTPLPLATLSSGPPAKVGAVPLQDAERQQYALLLEHSALDFLLAHGIAHIANGHLGWAADHGQPFLAEQERESDNRLPRMARQVMEMDADRTAATARVGSIHRMLSDLSKTVPPPWCLFYGEDLPTALYHWMFAITTALLLFRSESNPSASPETRLRQALVLAAASDASKNWEPEVAGHCTNAMLDATLEAERALGLLTGTKPASPAAPDEFTKATQSNVLKTLNEYWERSFLKELRPYAYVSLDE